MINIALLGCGTVGSQIAKLLNVESNHITQQTGIKTNLSRILVRDLSKKRSVPRHLLNESVEEIIDDPEIDIAIEVLGGLHPAYEYVARLLDRGVHVVTANKSLIANHGQRLEQIAQQSGAKLLYGASVCAAMPVVNILESLRGDRVQSLRGIINGACNFILTSMATKGINIEQATELARNRGLVEPDPSADLSGRDAVEKLCILAHSIGIVLRPEDVEQVGIESVVLDDLWSARRKGYVLKQVATLDDRNARVGPALLAADDQLSTIVEEDNAIIIEAEFAGTLYVQGKGAGPLPTASAVLSDVLAILAGNCNPDYSSGIQSELSQRKKGNRKRYYVRLPIRSNIINPKSVLCKLRAFDVPISTIEFTAQNATFLTAPVECRALEQAIKSIDVHNYGDAFLAQCS